MNVIVVCFDTLRADVAEGTYPETLHTPTLKRLREESCLFTSAYAEGLPTIPVRRAFFTGTPSFPWRYRIDDRGSSPHLHGWHAIPPQQTTVAERLASNGVMTGLVADTYHMFKPTMNFTRGFLSWEFIRGQEHDRWHCGPLSVADVRPFVASDDPSPERHPGIVQYLLNVQDRRREEDYFVARVFSRAIGFIEEAQTHQPFFLWIDSFTPHEFWDPPKRFADRYYKAPPGVKDYIYPQIAGKPFEQFTPQEVARTRALYLGYCSFADKWLGRFVEELEERALLRNTILVITADHGTELMDRGRFGKSPDHLHSFNTRIPMIVRHPDPQFVGRRVSGFVETPDLAPTILNWLGVPAYDLQGRDFWTLATGKRRLIRDHALSAWGQFASVRSHKYNLIVDTVTPGAQPRLYDLGRDPAELDDVARKCRGPLRSLMGKLEQRIGLPLPAKYEHVWTNEHDVGYEQWLHSNLAR